MSLKCPPQSHVFKYLDPKRWFCLEGCETFGTRELPTKEHCGGSLMVLPVSTFYSEPYEEGTAVPSHCDVVLTKVRKHTNSFLSSFCQVFCYSKAKVTNRGP